MDYNIIFTIKEPYNVEYTTDDISLGTEIKETFDKSYDTASLTLPLSINHILQLSYSYLMLMNLSIWIC